jgi:hypothetical protein
MWLSATRSVVSLLSLVIVLVPATKADIGQGRVWYEEGVATATGGFDLKHQRTLINKWYIAVFGPDDIEAFVKGYVQNCVEGAAIAAVEAFKETPGEASVKLGAAEGAFHGSLVGCLSARSAARAYIGKFELGYIRRGYWEDGLNAQLSVDDPRTKNYVLLHNLIKDRLPDPLNKLIVFYINSQKLPDINFNIKPPEQIGKFLARLPDPPNLQRLQEDAERKLSTGGKHLADEVKKEAETVGKAIGSDAAEAFKRGLPMIVAGTPITGDPAAVAKSVQDAAQNAVAQFGPKAKKVFEDSLPRVEGQRVIAPCGIGCNVAVGSDGKVLTVSIPGIPSISVDASKLPVQLPPPPSPSHPPQLPTPPLPIHLPKCPHVNVPLVGDTCVVAIGCEC